MMAVQIRQELGLDTNPLSNSRPFIILNQSLKESPTQQNDSALPAGVFYIFGIFEDSFGSLVMPDT